MKILFVCLGNICRSPTAEIVFREIAAREAPDLRIEIDSAGTAAYHVGSPPDSRTRQAALRRGYDMSAAPGARSRATRLRPLRSDPRNGSPELRHPAPTRTGHGARAHSPVSGVRTGCAMRPRSLIRTTVDRTDSRKCWIWWRLLRADCYEHVTDRSATGLRRVHRASARYLLAIASAVAGRR